MLHENPQASVLLEVYLSVGRESYYYYYYYLICLFSLFQMSVRWAK